MTISHQLQFSSLLQELCSNPQIGNSENSLSRSVTPMIRSVTPVLVPLIFLTTPLCANAQPRGYNYDENKVPEYKLPEILTSLDGTKVKDKSEWEQKRRPEIVKLFEHEVYGRIPGKPDKIEFVEEESSENALDGKAVRKQVIIRIRHHKQKSPDIRVLIYLPKDQQAAVPVFLGLNFKGNHSINPDPNIVLSQSWMRPGATITNNKASEKSRGVSSSRWDVDSILKRGYGLVTVYYGDIDPDFDDGFQNGVHPLFQTDKKKKPAADEWGSISAWSWGLSRVMDYLETNSQIDHTKVALLGHSRLGKTSLWAGASDTRFAIVISNNSGCGGAALSRRAFGETVKRINTSFPHWFCDNFVKYNDNEAALPVDQHMLIALMAPRPVYVASASEDLWADPQGEFLSAKLAEPVYQLYGLKGLPTKTRPGLNTSVQGTIGYHLRKGKHDVTSYDWEQYLNFADKHFRNQKED